MALSKDEKSLLGRLYAKVAKAERRNRILEAYYQGEQRVEQLGLAIPPELRRFLTIVAWPGVYVDAIAERITLEGFELPNATEADQDLWRIWQANGLDRESKLAHLEALKFGQAFIVVGAGDADTPDAPSADGGDEDRERDAGTPLITVESSNEMAVELSPRTRQPVAAAKFYTDDGVSHATLYLPDVTIWLEREAGVWTWVEKDRDEHGLGVVPVVPLTHREQLSQRDGRSAMTRVMGLTDAAARALTNAQVATEALAVPQRWAAGLTQADFKDPKTGEQLTTWETYFGALWATQNPDAKFGAFTAADLANFSGIVNHYGGLISSVTGLPLRYLGQATTNPPSAEGILADESRLIKQVEDFETGAESSWERAQDIGVRIRTGRWDRRMKQLATKWRSAATPTRAQAADAAVKLVQADIIPAEASWDDLGYSQTRQRKLRELRDAELARSPVAQIAARLDPPPVIDPAADDTELAGAGAG